jgi:pyruvate/2-oxoglutarate dehydrogenase complex dihydrolipoamide acyltransferase (E2) component
MTVVLVRFKTPGSCQVRGRNALPRPINQAAAAQAAAEQAAAERAAAEQAAAEQAAAAQAASERAAAGRTAAARVLPTSNPGGHQYFRTVHPQLPRRTPQKPRELQEFRALSSFCQEKMNLLTLVLSCGASYPPQNLDSFYQDKMNLISFCVG